MPAAVLTPEAWAEVRRASEAGVDDETLATRYGIKQTAIRKRRQVEAWITPERAHAEAQKAKLQEQHKRIATGTISRISQDPTKAIELVGKSLADYAERYPLRVVEYLSSKVEEAVTSDTLPVIDSWKSMSAADQMIRRNLGLDRPQQNIQVNLWGSGTSTSFTGQNVESLFREAE